MVQKVIICFVLLLVGTAGAAEESSKRVVALKIEAFKNGFRLCSRKGPENIATYWELRQAEAERIDRALMKHIARSGLRSQLSLAPDGYVRQYLGIVRDGRQVVYINAFGARAG